MKIIEKWKKLEIFFDGKSLLAMVSIRVLKIFGMIAIGIFWVLGIFLYNQWDSKTTREKIFLKLANAGAYDEKIVGIKAFELSSVINLVESNDVKGSIPEVTDDAIILNGNKKIVFLWRAMPKFFPDVEFGAHKIRCVQGRVRKKRSDMSFEKFEDKFVVTYTNSVPTESAQAFKARLGFILDENIRKKEDRLRGISNESIDSHSALFSGNCIDTFQGWVSREAD